MVNTPEELASWLRLALTPGVGPETARRLLAAWGQPSAIFEQTETALRQVVSALQAQALCEAPAGWRDVAGSYARDERRRLQSPGWLAGDRVRADHDRRGGLHRAAGAPVAAGTFAATRNDAPRCAAANGPRPGPVEAVTS